MPANLKGEEIRNQIRWQLVVSATNPDQYRWEDMDHGTQPAVSPTFNGQPDAWNWMNKHNFSGRDPYNPQPGWRLAQ